MKVRVNITVDPAAWKLFRMYCLQNDTTASKEIETFIKLRLEQQEKKGGPKKK